MNNLENYIESLFKNFDSEDENLEDLKLDMKNNLLEAINELKEQGYTEAESIDIVMKRMGEKDALRSEMSKLYSIKKFNFKSLILILMSFSIFMIMMNLFKLQGIFLPIDFFFALLPIYIIYEISYIGNCFKKRLFINKKYEIIKIIFVLYIFILLGKIIFPMYSYINLANGSIPEFIFNPFFSLNSELGGMFRLLVYFIPLGALLPILFKYFRSLKRCIMLGFAIFIINSVLIFIKGILGMNLVNIISLEFLIIYLLGISIGYYIYVLILNKKKYRHLHFL